MEKHKKNEEYVLRITDIGVNGEGIGHLDDGYTLFVQGAVPGDEIRVRIVKAGSKFGYGRVMEITGASADRCESPCSISGRCGGCQLMHIKYEAQLKYKESKVKNDLIRIGGVSEDIIERITEPVIGMEDPLRYRNKAQYPVGYDKEGRIVFGFYAARSHDIIPVEDCLLGSDNDRSILEAVRDWMGRCDLSAYDESSGTGLVRHVLIRHSAYDGSAMVCIVVNAPSQVNSNELTKLLSGIREIKSVYFNSNMERTNVILGDKYFCVFGEDTIEDRIMDKRFKISPASFYQVNPVQTEKLYSTALEYAGLTGNETVWDLYCGIGTISLFLAPQAKEVYGIEIVPEAIDDAWENAKLNGISNAHFYCGAVEEVLPKVQLPHPEVIVVDPPRKGLDEICLKTIIDTAPERVVYVSCDPATLSRDIHILCDNGYELRRVRPCDMFPNTVHVETVVCLSNKNAKPRDYVEIGVDAEDYYRIKDSENKKGK